MKVFAPLDGAERGHDAVFVKLQFAAENGIGHPDDESLAGVDAHGGAAVGEPLADDPGPVAHDRLLGRFASDFVPLEADLDEGIQRFRPAIDRARPRPRDGPEVGNQILGLAGKVHLAQATVCGRASSKSRS